MEKLTYAEWFDKLTPAFARLEDVGYVLTPGAQRDAAMNALGNQHNGERAVKFAVADSVERHVVARPGEYFLVTPFVEYQGVLGG